MHEHVVLDRVFAPVGSPLDVVVVPPRYRGDLLVADRTEPLLLLPEQPQRPAARQGPGHLHAQAFLEVRFPGGGSDSNGEKTNDLQDDSCSDALSQTMVIEKPPNVRAGPRDSGGS